MRGGPWTSGPASSSVYNGQKSSHFVHPVLGVLVGEETVKHKNGTTLGADVGGVASNRVGDWPGRLSNRITRQCRDKPAACLCAPTCLPNG